MPPPQKKLTEVSAERLSKDDTQVRTEMTYLQFLVCGIAMSSLLFIVLLPNQKVGSLLSRVEVRDEVRYEVRDRVRDEVRDGVRVALSEPQLL